MVALRATARQVIHGVALVGAANVQAHSDRRAEKTAEVAKYDAFGPNHGGAFRPFDCGRAASYNKCTIRYFDIIIFRNKKPMSSERCFDERSRCCLTILC